MKLIHTQSMIDACFFVASSDPVISNSYCYICNTECVFVDFGKNTNSFSSIAMQTHFFMFVLWLMLTDTLFDLLFY